MDDTLIILIAFLLGNATGALLALTWFAKKVTQTTPHKNQNR